MLAFDIRLEPPLHPKIIGGAIVSAIGALILALGWSAGHSLTVTSSGSGAPSAEDLRALLQRMAPDSPQGVEVPRGTDSDLLSAIGVAEDSSNTLVAAAVKVLKLLRPPTPWQLEVSSGAADSIQVALTRNRRLIDAFATEKATAFRWLEDPPDPDAKATGTDAKDVDDELPALAPFAAALAVVRIANETGAKQGLAGATKFRSVALQYLGGLEKTGSPRQQALLAEAVSLDPGNLLARTAYWHALFRLANEEKDLKRYAQLLDGLLIGAFDACGSGNASKLANEPSLALRLLYMRVAVGINLNAIPEGGPTAEAKQELKEKAELLAVGAREPG